MAALQMLANGKVGKKAKREAAYEIEQEAAPAKTIVKKRKREERAATAEAKVRQAHRRPPYACLPCIRGPCLGLLGWVLC